VREQTNGLSEFASEAESFGSLEGMLKADLFERARQAKEDLSEMFFAAEITAAGIDCNLRIGNKFVDLVHAERDVTSIEGIEEKYGYSYDQIISDAAGKTLELLEILKNEPEAESEKGSAEQKLQKDPASPSKKIEEPSRSFAFLRVNKWLLAATIVIACLSVGLYFWADNYEESESIATVASDFDFSDSGVEKYLKSSKRTTETVYGQTTAEWDLLEEKTQKQILQNAYKSASTRGVKKIQFTNGKGRTVGFVSADRLDIYAQ
jgi:hypothetical protein